MTISKQKLVLALTLGLLSAVSAQAVTGQEKNQETPNTESLLSERNARLEEQQEEALAQGLRPTLTLVDLDAECPHYDPAREIEDKDKKLAELQAKLQGLEEKNKPAKTNSWSTRKKVAVAAAAVGSFIAIQYARDVIDQEGVVGLIPKPAIIAFLKLYAWHNGINLTEVLESNDDFFDRLHREEMSNAQKKVN